MNIKKNLANSQNYGGKRSVKGILFIVIHYTANDGDTDENNGKYFHNNIVKASAHYFVDSDSITQSVPDDYVAWSVGGAKYPTCNQTGGGKYYGKCTNANSISIELCDDIKNGTIYPSNKTILNALELTRMLMKKYNIPVSNVIRHFDVNGKPCPAYWVDDNKWKNEYWNKIAGVPYNEQAVVTEKPETKTETAPTSQNVPYKVKVTADVLNVRSDAGASYPVVMTIKKGEVYTIVEESNGWGKLKSGAGYISLKFTQKV